MAGGERDGARRKSLEVRGSHSGHGATLTVPRRWHCGNALNVSGTKIPCLRNARTLHSSSSPCDGSPRTAIWCKCARDESDIAPDARADECVIFPLVSDTAWEQSAKWTYDRTYDNSTTALTTAAKRLPKHPSDRKEPSLWTCAVMRVVLTVRQGCARAAGAVQRQVVAGHDKAAWDQMPQIPGATRKAVCSVARRAVEVVVMAESR